MARLMQQSPKLPFVEPAFAGPEQVSIALPKLAPTLPSVGACRRASWAPFRPRTETWILSGKVLIYVMKYRLPKASTQFIHTPSVCGLLWFGCFGDFRIHHTPLYHYLLGGGGRTPNTGLVG